MHHTRWLGAAAVALIALGCGDSGTGPSAGGLTLESAARVSGRVGAGGDTLTATSSSGARYSLGIPASAVRDTVTITVTPVTAARSGALAKAHLVAAVRMEPSGTVFARAAALTIELPAGVDPTKVVGFLADGDGGSAL